MDKLGRNYGKGKCKNCGIKFSKTTGSQIFCGSAIKKIGCGILIQRRQQKEHATRERRKNREEYNKKTYEWRKNNPDKMHVQLEIAKQKNYAKRLCVISHYSNSEYKCACCGEEQYEFLTIDHIKGGGTKHLKKIGVNLVPWLLKNGFPNGYQILCYNCNCGKGKNDKCPHANQGKGIKLIDKGSPSPILFHRT